MSECSVTREAKGDSGWCNVVEVCEGSVPSLEEDALDEGEEAETAEKLYRCSGASGSGGLMDEVPRYRGG